MAFQDPEAPATDQMVDTIGTQLPDPATDALFEEDLEGRAPEAQMVDTPMGGCEDLASDADTGENAVEQYNVSESQVPNGDVPEDNMHLQELDGMGVDVITTENAQQTATPQPNTNVFEFDSQDHNVEVTGVANKADAPIESNEGIGTVSVPDVLEKEDAVMQTVGAYQTRAHDAPADMNTDAATSDIQGGQSLPDDGQSLFVPEHDPAPATALTTAPSILDTSSAPPLQSTLQPSPRPKPSNQTMLAKIRNLKKAQDTKAAAKPWPKSTFNNEALINSILSPRSEPLVHKPVNEHVTEEEADRLAAVAFQKKKESFARLKRSQGGRLTFQQDIEWIKIQKSEAARIEKRKRDKVVDREWDRKQREAADKVAEAEYIRAKEYYQDLIQEQGQLNFQQNTEWIKIQRDEAVRAENKMHGQQLDQEWNVRNSGGITFGAERDQTQQDISDEEQGHGFDLSVPSKNSNKRQRREMPYKSPGLSMMEAELQSMSVGLEDDLYPKKKTRRESDADDSQTTGSLKTSRSSKSKSSSSKSAKAKTTAKKSTGVRKSAKQKRQEEKSLKQVQSLFSSDVFLDQADQNAAEQPTFKSKNKQEALKEIIASVPLGDKKAARDDMATINNASRDFNGRGAVKADGKGMWSVRNMKTSLKPYQVLGSAFMRRRENALEEPRGGLMADQMGLGKTLMMLANIVNGLPPKGEQPRTTLLVASQNLLRQWAQEIQTHTADNLLTVMKYGSGNRLDSNRSYQILQQHDIVLTTYGEVMQSYPKNEPPIECQTAEEKIKWWHNVFETGRGVLHRMKFYRIVLDEAQAIKNHNSRTSIACRALMADHKWALTGTPVLNSLTELYPYFKFLNVPYTGSFKIFKHNYCDASNPQSAERLLARLETFMIRRTHSEVMFGAPILKLPRADQATYWCEFNPIERNIYDIVRQRFVKRINFMAKSGELERSYSNAMVMLLRLRQLTAHILMLQFVMRDLLEREDIERIRQVIREAASDKTNTETILVIRKQLDVLAREEKKKAEEMRKVDDAKEKKDQKESHAQVDISAVKESRGVEQDGQEVENIADEITNGPQGRLSSGKGFGKEFDFKPYIDTLAVGDNWEKVKKKAQCSSCGKRPVNPWITSCNHLYCQDCYEKEILLAAEILSDNFACKNCGQTFQGARECERDSETEYKVPETRSRKKDKEPARMERENIKDDWLSLGGGKVLPSAKTIAIKAQILNWTRENPKVKIIIYTQFLAM
jgi:SNF2 family DNA or RNA helicase